MAKAIAKTTLSLVDFEPLEEKRYKYKIQRWNPGNLKDLDFTFIIVNPNSSILRKVSVDVIYIVPNYQSCGNEGEIRIRGKKLSIENHSVVAVSANIPHRIINDSSRWLHLVCITKK